MTVFHITQNSHLDKIFAEGLLPRIGRRSKECGEKEPAIFCFPSRDDCDTALAGWLGECFADVPENGLSILEIHIPAGSALREDAGFEVAVLGPIAPENIIRVYNEDWVVSQKTVPSSYELSKDSIRTKGVSPK